ncbi:hypothetical protein EDB92DRAFT_1908333 [Lactarius akahatsu]|uniref:Uncharacterized protein n=1 Tax=Lactarius akahatsu TaxID=416441 RepID=A0AAD4L3H2_9AGAM|nr:hypothetical protein EDB92DRAFT_1908333 [Lactarius akahatsu]
MVDFHDLAVIKADFTAFVNVMHCMVGVFLWDFFTTLDFEWDYITGRRKFRWTLLLYSFSRLGALGTAICNIVGFNVTHEINCQQWVLWSLITAYTSVTCASALITLRVVAIWGRNYLVVGLTIGLWLTNLGFLLFGIVMVCLEDRSPWSPIAGRCILENTVHARDNVAMTVATDIAQLIIMLVGLLRSRNTKYGMFRHLYVQGLIWLVAVTIGELPAVIFISLNLNDPWNMMFQNLALFTMEIFATRMYRSLANYNMGFDKDSHGPESHDGGPWRVTV